MKTKEKGTVPEKGDSPHSKQTIHFGHSPDPDDAFMFYAIAKNKISLDGFQIDHVVDDIESLNQRAIRKAELEATAVSVHAFAHLADKYAIMRAGASIGEKYGPIIVSKNRMSSKEICGKKIAIPGKLTTANLILQLFEPNFNPVLVPFDQIMDHVLAGKSDAGLIIHEGQITYKEKGLYKVIDLGEWWWNETKLPLPLGIDALRKDLGMETMKRLSKVFKESILYALKNRQPALDYAIQFGRGLRPDLNDRFVGMYVNDFTIDIGERGEAGIRKIFELAAARGVLSPGICAQMQFV